MADLAAADVTVTLATADPKNPKIVGVQRRGRGTIAFGDGAKTYPADGVPMPTYPSFGLHRNLADIIVLGVRTSALEARYDVNTAAVRLFNAGAELVSGVDAPPALTVDAEWTGW